MDSTEVGFDADVVLGRGDGVTGVLWEALFNDAGVMAFVVDGDGIVRWMNHITRAVADTTGDCTGMHDLCTGSVATERLGVTRSVLETGEPISLVGMCGGMMRRSTYRALPGTGLVLVTCRSLATEAVEDHDNVIGGVPATPAKAQDAGAIAKLTPREREVLMLIGRGLTTQQIADRLGRSVKTVEWHRLSLGTKFNVTNRVELARIAIHAGISPVSGEEAAASMPKPEMPKPVDGLNIKPDVGK